MPLRIRAALSTELRLDQYGRASHCRPWANPCVKTDSLWWAILISSRLVQNADRLDSEIIYDRDFDYDYFGFKVTLSPTEQKCAQARRLYEILDSHLDMYVSDITSASHSSMTSSFCCHDLFSLC